MKLKESGDPARQQVAVRPLWIGLPNLEANLQQPDGWNKQEASAQPVQEYIQKARYQTEQDIQLRMSTRQRRSPSYLHDFVTGRSWSLYYYTYLYCDVLVGKPISMQLFISKWIHSRRSNICVGDLLYLRSEPLDDVHASDELGTGRNKGWCVFMYTVSIIQNI
jgi:hypothetical protein